MQAALRQEKPQLEVRRAELLRREEELKMSLHQLQENVLHELANAHGDILQNKVNSHSHVCVSAGILDYLFLVINYLQSPKNIPLG